MRKITTASVAVFALTSFAQQPRPCPDPDILNGLVLLGRSELKMTVTRGSTGFLGTFRAPDGFNLIGTGVRSSMYAVAYKTSQGSGPAHAAMIAALGAEGWSVEAAPGATFHVAGSPKESTLCHDGERRVVMTTEVPGTSYVTINTYPGWATRACNAPDPAMSTAYATAAPQFRFPAGTTLAQGLGFGGGGGSSQAFTSSSRIISPESAARLVDHLASQIAQQGWQPDSGWSGTASAGSTWRKTVNGQPSTGTLSIVRASVDTYDVSFTLMSAL